MNFLQNSWWAETYSAKFQSKSKSKTWSRSKPRYSSGSGGSKSKPRYAPYHKSKSDSWPGLWANNFWPELKDILNNKP